MQGFEIFLFAETAVETVCGRVGGVARAAGREAGNQLAVKLGTGIVIVLYLYNFHGACSIL